MSPAATLLLAVGPLPHAPYPVNLPVCEDRLVAAEPDFTRPGPWVTTLAIGGNPSGGEMRWVTFSDHGSGDVRPTWLNEKLLFVQARWGRIASSDLVLDVERAALLVAEDADLAALLGPCEPRPATP